MIKLFLSKKHNICWGVALISLALFTLFAVPFYLNGMKFSFAGLDRGMLFSSYVAAYTLEATVLIAVLIYYLQRCDENREAERRSQNAKRILAVEVGAGLQECILHPENMDISEISPQLSSMLLTYLPDMQKVLSEEMLHHLVKVVDLLTSISKLEKEEDRYESLDYLKDHIQIVIQPWLYPIYCSPFCGCLENAGSYRQLLNQETYELMAILCGWDNSQPVKGRNIIDNSNGQKLFEVGMDDKIIVYDSYNSIICNAIIDLECYSSLHIWEGWADLESYTGEFHEGRRHGKGVSYDYGRKHKLEEGIWENDELAAGTKYDMVIEYDGDGVNLIWLYWYNYPDKYDILKDVDKDNLDQYFVCDYYFDDTEEQFLNKKKLFDFVAENDPEMLEYLRD